MKVYIQPIIVFLLLFSNIIIADCSFENEKYEYTISNAKMDAESSFKKDEVKFIGVANGIGPSRPGFELIKMTKCIMLDTKWKLLWVGGDSKTCKDHKDLENKAIKYAKLFNQTMIKLAKSSESYECAGEL